MAEIYASEKATSYEKARAFAQTFACDGECNKDFDVCIHLLKFNCEGCQTVIERTVEGLQDAEHGMCMSCSFAF